MRPAVSVIVPIFNTRKYVEKCVLSIASQTLANIEILCVDEGSTDGSHEIVTALQANDPRIRLLRCDDDRGLGAARNTGVRAAQADYIASVDSDDFIDGGMLEALHTAAIAGNFDVVASGMREVNEQGETLRTIIPRDRTIIIEDRHHDVFAVTDPSLCNKLWKRSIFTDNNLYFDESVFYEDLAWTYQALLQSRRIRILGDVYYNYLLRTGSKTHSMGCRNIADFAVIFEMLRDALAANGVAQEHAEPFRRLVRQTLKYHAGKAFDLGGTTDETLRYLRCILAIKLAYTLPEAYGNTPRDAQAIIHAIEFDPVDERDVTLRAQAGRISHLTALVRGAGWLLRLPLHLFGAVSRLSIAVGRWSGWRRLYRRGLRMRRVQRQIVRISREG